MISFAQLNNYLLNFRFLVVFRQDSQPTIWARRFNADGTPAAASFLASDDQNYPMLNLLEVSIGQIFDL